jgi:hypothetical protein
MAYQRGCLKAVKRKEGEAWVLRYRVMGADGRRVENTLPIGLVREFPKEKDAWREVDKLGLLVRINEAPGPGRVRFDFLAEQTPSPSLSIMSATTSSTGLARPSRRMSNRSKSRSG